LKKAIIVCFTFPPFPGIGGRRWAKFAKYLYRNKIDIQVIAAQKKHKPNSVWNEDIHLFRDKITYVPTGYPNILTTVPTGFLQRWQYRFSLLWVKRKCTNGNYFDHSAFWGNAVKNEVEKKIQRGYSNVILSCGPFRYTQEVLELKNQYPHVKFILDFRDPWSNNKTSFGFQTIDEMRRMDEIEYERNAIQKADNIISVSEEMNQWFRQISGKSETNFITIGNGFDRDDFENSGQDESKSPDRKKWRFVLTGTLYHKAEYVYREFINALSEIYIENPEWKSKTEFHFYGEVPGYFFDLPENCNENIHFGGKLDLHQVYEKIGGSDVCMLFLTDDLVYSRSTKFYEYLAMGKPIAVFSTEGDTGKFAVTKRLGFMCRPSHMKADILYMLDQMESEAFHFNRYFEIQEYDVATLTEKIIECLQ